MRSVTLLALLTVALSVSAFGQMIDPIGFCPPPATVSGCTTANGLGSETIGVAATSFAMMKNGGQAGDTSISPWDLLVLVPNDNGGAPAITSSQFTQFGTTADKGQFTPTTANDIYKFALNVTDGDNSMNASNLFCDGGTYPCTKSNEITASGSLPSFFEVFVYQFTPGIVDSNTSYKFSVGGSGLAPGTYLAGYGGSNPFSTPFTTAGLVDGSGCTGTNGCTAGPGGGTVPEPTSLILLGTIGLLVTMSIRKRYTTA